MLVNSDSNEYLVEKLKSEALRADGIHVNQKEKNGCSEMSHFRVLEQDLQRKKRDEFEYIKWSKGRS